MNGKTAMDGLSGSGRAREGSSVISSVFRPSFRQYTRIGLAMFLTVFSPLSTKS
jgi:hypothetical protein